MADEDITEKQVVSFLLNKRQLLIEDLKKDDLALEALNINSYLTSFSPENMFSSSLKESQPIAVKSPLEKETKFDINGKLDSKIAFALTHKTDLNKDQILEVIVKNLPGLDKHKFEKTLAVRLSHLLKSNMIGATKSGRNYTYRLLTT